MKGMLKELGVTLLLSVLLVAGALGVGRLLFGPLDGGERARLCPCPVGSSPPRDLFLPRQAP